MKHNFARNLMAGCAIAALCYPANAANITHSASKSPDFDYEVRISGWIEPGDADRFLALTKNDSSVKVYLSGPGGYFLDAAAIGEQIHDKGFETIVLDDTDCTSGCAYIWLAGNPRVASEHSRIGFHGIYVGGTNQPTAGGNALLGYYLAKLGLSASAVVFMADKPSDDLEWLTAEKADEMGIKMDILPSAAGPSSVTTPPNVPKPVTSQSKRTGAVERTGAVDPWNLPWKPAQPPWKTNWAPLPLQPLQGKN